jgi:hypothetical protein
VSEGRTIAALILAVGLAIAGWLVGAGFREGRADVRYTTVKGLAERAVKANLALWPIRFVATNNDLAAAEARITADTQTVTDFVTRHGIAADGIHLSRLSVNDLYAQAYRSGTVQRAASTNRESSARPTQRPPSATVWRAWGRVRADSS